VRCIIRLAAEQPESSHWYLAGGHWAGVSSVPVAPPTTGLGALPSCGQTCFNNVQAQYSALGCSSPSDAYCLCNNVNFGYGIRDCAQATATHTGR
jgi:hypothetical protein